MRTCWNAGSESYAEVKESFLILQQTSTNHSHSFSAIVVSTCELAYLSSSKNFAPPHTSPSARLQNRMRIALAGKVHLRSSQFPVCTIFPTISAASSDAAASDYKVCEKGKSLVRNARLDYGKYRHAMVMVSFNIQR